MMNKLNIIFLLLSIYGCSDVNVSQWHFPYSPIVKQGTYLQQTQVNAIHVGLTKEQVKFIVDSPLSTFIFNNNIWAFNYREYSNNKLVTAYKLILYFDQQGILVNIDASGKFFADNWHN
jgi:outer membrane protein assembly factor BamE